MKTITVIAYNEFCQSLWKPIKVGNCMSGHVVATWASKLDIPNRPQYIFVLPPLCPGLATRSNVVRQILLGQSLLQLCVYHTDIHSLWTRRSYTLCSFHSPGTRPALYTQMAASFLYPGPKVLSHANWAPDNLLPEPSNSTCLTNETPNATKRS